METKIITAGEITTNHVLVNGKGQVAYVRQVTRNERQTFILVSGDRYPGVMLHSRQLRVRA